MSTGATTPPLRATVPAAWASTEDAAAFLGMPVRVLRDALARRARRVDGMTEARFDGIIARRVGRLWKVWLGAAWTAPEITDGARRSASAAEEFLRYQCAATWHEAGHAVVAHALGIKVTGVTICDEDGTARTWTRGRPWFRASDFDGPGSDVAFGLAGYLAERRARIDTRKRALDGAAEDFENVMGWCPWPATDHNNNMPARALWRERLGSVDGWRHYVRAWMRVAHRILRDNWQHVRRLADALVYEDEIAGDDLRRLLRGVRRPRLGRAPIGVPPRRRLRAAP
jgi:hypothetical protein